MKSAAIFCVLATVCFFGTGDAANNAGTEAITRLNQRIRTASSGLERYGKNMVYNLNSKLNNQKLTELANFNSIVNPAINDVQSAIAKAKADGKNADHCYEPARLALRQATFIDGEVELNQCRSNGQATVAPVKSNIDATILLGNGITNELNSISINCISSNALQYQNCIIAQIPNASAKVQNFETTSSELQRTGDTLSSSAVTTAFSCNQAVTQKVRQVASDVRVSSNNCIANA